ncbi:hypothetical protein [Streptomyces sp. NPDC089915]|uniref:hypothetical protein n=1 Tax=Streptomyces sp. NPDC089915 TaxID=3155186 RepID=UPI00342269DA
MIILRRLLPPLAVLAAGLLLTPGSAQALQPSPAPGGTHVRAAGPLLLDDGGSREVKSQADSFADSDTGE